MPPRPLFAFVNNVIEMKTDGFKLCNVSRRPWPTGAQDIGTWIQVLDVMSYVSFLSNALLVSYTGPALENATLVGRGARARQRFGSSSES